jgi:hypothetical protein
MLEGTFGSINFAGQFLDNLGGARLFRFAGYTHFATLAPGIQGTVIAESTFNEPFGWNTWRPIEDTADLQEEESLGNGGPLWENTFTCELAGDTDGKRMVIDSVSRLPIIAEITDNNGLVRRMGELADPAWMTVRHSTGRGTAARNSWSITIQWKSQRPLFFVNPEFVPDAEALPLDEDSLSDISGALGP